MKPPLIAERSRVDVILTNPPFTMYFASNSRSSRPLAEQRRIVAKQDALLAEADALKRPQAETAAELDGLLPDLLDRAFKGEL